MKRLIGVILCGGESRRMGKDKGLIKKDGITWAEYMANKLAFAGMPVVFSINPMQTAAYAAHIDPSRLIADSTALTSIAGPLKGLLTIHEQFPGRDLLLLACDMLDMDNDTIRQLIDVYSASSGPALPGQYASAPAAPYLFYVYQEGSFAEPFCCIYTSAGLASVHLKALQGRLTDFSLQSLLRAGKTKKFAILRPEAFRNYNEYDEGR